MFSLCKDGAATIASPIEKVHIHTKESVLLKCGNYVADLIDEKVSETCEIVAIHLYPDVLREIYKNEVPSFAVDKKTNYAKKVMTASVVDHFIDSLTFYFDNPALVNSELIILKLKELVLLLLQSSNAETILDLLSFLFNSRRATLIEVIETHVYSNFSMDQLAVLVGLSLSTFKRDFQVHYNDTPANYIKGKKLDKAAGLLASSDLSISEICYNVGFNDLPHFTRSFNQRYNSSPSAYRESMKNK